MLWTGSMYGPAKADRVAGASIWLKFATTAAALKGAPSAKVTPFFNWNTYVFPFGEIVQEVASHGCGRPSLPKNVRLSNWILPMSCSTSEEI